MSKAAHLSKHLFLILLLIVTAHLTPLRADGTAELKKNESGMYQDMFDQSVFYEGTNFLRLDRLYRKIFNKKVRAENVNAFDELADDTFFTNRHSRKKLSSSELAKGSEPTGGPDANGSWTILKGEFLSSQTSSLLIQDSRGDQYELRFDTFDQPELATASEVIASRFYHAIGYNVPPYSIVTFDLDKLKPDSGATVIDRSGFQRKFTQEKLKDLMLFLPMDSQSKYRASAQKILKGIEKGNFKFRGRRKDDPNDSVDHENRRDIRALLVFASWLNHYSIDESNTLDLLTEESGKQVLKHYLINFNTTLGSDTEGAKPPMFSHEFLIDYGETAKAFLSLGFWEKPWQKRWREANEEISSSSAIGYFDNRRFKENKFKPELPYYAFKDLTSADGFWAAKIIMSFSNDDIASIVKTGQLGKSDDEKYLVDILLNRRDLIGKYWFEKANPLDNFKIENNALTFDDLAVKYGFETQESTTYHVDVIKQDGKHGQKINSLESQKPSIELGGFLSGEQIFKLSIRTLRKNSKNQSASVWVKVNSKGILKIKHRD